MLVCAVIATLADAQFPGLERYAQDWLVRARGPLAMPSDIAIVAIDEASIARLGQFPWPRRVMAQIVDRVAAAKPRAIALDVLYVTPGNAEDDRALAESIRRAGNVAVAAQLIEPGRWLTPIPEVREAAAGVGHVNVLVEPEGVARELLVRSMDHEGRVVAALPVETLRVAENAARVTDTGSEIVVGTHRIPVQVPASDAVLSDSAQVLRPARMAIDYIGPTGSFGPRTYSAVDVLEGRVRPADLEDRFVLIGATAAGIGERFPSPFLHTDSAVTGQHGTTMPGVEVLANALNTILRGRFYRPLPGWGVLLWSALLAALVLAALELPHAWRQILGLAMVVAMLPLASYLALTRMLVVLPLAPGFAAVFGAAVLGLMRRTLETSARLDRNIADLARARNVLVPDAQIQPALETIVRLARARGATLIEGSHRVQYGDTKGAAQRIDLDGGRLELFADALPQAEPLRLCTSIARASLDAFAPEQPQRLLPHALEAKANVVGALHAQLLERTQFVDHALRSAEDGLLIAGPDGAIRFANRSAATILQSTEHNLLGRNFFDRLAECEQGSPAAFEDTLARLLLDRALVEREVAIRGPRSRQYILRLTPVAAGDGPVAGIVASFSDITRHKELEQTKNDVIALVSHEMRTPLAAIQGMSELLANYQMDAERSHQMSTAINDEAKRLTRMITEYLDIARLESGKTVVRRAPVRVDQILDRVLLLHEPVAAARNIRLEDDFTPEVPAVLADADLLARAVGNLVSNAIKYSPPDTTVRVGVRATSNAVEIAVEDHGYGIPAADLPRVFDKFYRVPRVADAGTPGTGLGLALVREVAELHGGAVYVRSEVGAGSTFTLTIPLEEARN